MVIVFESFYSSGNAAQIKREVQSEDKQLNAAKEQAAMNMSAMEHQSFMEDQNKKADLIKWQQELDIEVLKHKLRNEFWDAEAGAWMRKKLRIAGKQLYMDPLMSEDGIAAVETCIDPFIGENAKNLINCNIDEKRILMMLKRTCLDLNHVFTYNYDNYFTNPTPSNMTLAKRIIKNAITPTPFRAINGFSKKQDNMATKRIETMNDGGQQQPKKLFGVI